MRMLELYRFSDFELDEARFELRRAGHAVTVQPKVLRMLLHLVAERERAVTTQELFHVLWPGERVGTTSIRRAVFGVRRALGEHADSQCSVRTVRGFGYQFVLPVHAVPARASTAQVLPASIWDADVTAFGMADTLPLYGRAAERMREEALKGWHSHLNV
jgi:DNA-binding winged helix-turn-helix (wHTH) protein